MTDFIILGPLPNAYRTIPHFAKYELFLGNGSPKIFTAPDGSEKKFGNIKWFTTFDIPRKPLPACVDKTPEEYRRYLNADGINVDRLKDIPCGYDGVMGVPLTFLEHDYGPYEILGVNFCPIVPKLEEGERLYFRIFIQKNIDQTQ